MSRLIEALRHACVRLALVGHLVERGGDAAGDGVLVLGRALDSDAALDQALSWTAGGLFKLAEFGLVVARGPWNVPRLLASMEEDQRVPEAARQIVQLLAAQLDEVGKGIAEVDARILAWHKANPISRRLATIPGIGPLLFGA